MQLRFDLNIVGFFFIILYSKADRFKGPEFHAESLYMTQDSR